MVRLEIWRSEDEKRVKVEIKNATGTKFLKIYGTNIISDNMALTNMEKVVSRTDLTMAIIEKKGDAIRAVDEDKNTTIYKIEWMTTSEKYRISITHAI